MLEPPRSGLLYNLMALAQYFMDSSASFMSLVRLAMSGVVRVARVATATVGKAARARARNFMIADSSEIARKYGNIRTPHEKKRKNPMAREI